MLSEAEQFLSRPEVVSLNKSKLYYATKICTFSFNKLEIEIEEAYVNESKRGQISTGINPELRRLYASAAPILVNPMGKYIRLNWKLYAAYCVTEELVGSCGHHAEEQFKGSVLRVYEKSNFLIHLGRDTGGHTGDLKHIKLITLNHLIDIAFCDWPEVVQISPEEQLPVF